MKIIFTLIIVAGYVAGFAQEITIDSTKQMIGNMREILDNVAHLNGYRVNYHTALPKTVYIINLPQPGDLQDMVAQMRAIHPFAYTIKDSTISLYPVYQYTIHNTLPPNAKPHIQFYYDSIQGSQALEFRHAPIDKILDFLATWYKTKLQVNMDHLPPIAASGFIALNMKKADAFAVVTRAHRLELKTEGNVQVAQRYIYFEELLDDYQLDSRFKSPPPKLKKNSPKFATQQQPSCNIFYDTVNQYWALSFKYMHPHDLVDTLMNYNRYFPVRMKFVPWKVGTASGVIPLHPHPKTLSSILCFKHKMWFYEHNGEYRIKKGGAGIPDDYCPLNPGPTDDAGYW